MSDGRKCARRAATVSPTVSLTGASIPTWLRSAAAAVVAVGVLVGVIGSGLAAFELAAAVQSPSVLVSLVIDDVERADLEYQLFPTAHSALGALTFHRGVPRRPRLLPWRWLCAPAASATFWDRLGVAGRYAPVISLASRELLTQFGIARR